MILAHRLASGPDTQYDLGLFWKNGTRSDVGSQIRSDSGCMLSIMAKRPITKLLLNQIQHVYLEKNIVKQHNGAVNYVNTMAK